MRELDLVPKVASKPKREVKVRIPRKAGLARFFFRPAGRTLIVAFAFSVFLGLGIFTYYYAKYSRLIDQKLRVGPFANTAKIYAAPATIGVGDAMTPSEIASELRRSGSMSCSHSRATPPETRTNGCWKRRR